MNKEELDVLLVKLEAAIAKGFPDIKNLESNEDEESLTMVFDLFETNKFLWELRKETNFIRIRFDADVKDRSYEELSELAEAMCEHIGKDVSPMIMDDKIVLQYLYSFDEIQDVSIAQKNIFYETIEFIHPIYVNIGLLATQEDGEEIEVRDNFALIDDEDNIFNYDEIDDDFTPPVKEEEVTEEETKEESEEVEYLDDDFLDDDDWNMDEVFKPDEEFDNKLDEFMESMNTTQYDADGYRDTELDDDGNISFENGIAETEFAEAQNKVKHAEGVLDGTIDALKSAMDTVSDLTASIFVREKEIIAREKSFEDNKKALDEKYEKFHTEYDEYLKEKEEFNGVKASAEAMEAKDNEIADLKAMLDEEQNGEAKQAYIRELRKKANYQEEHIEKLSEKLSQCNNVITSLKSHYEDTKNKAVAVTEDAEQKISDMKGMLRAEREARIADRNESENQIASLKEELEAAKNTPAPTSNAEDIDKLKDELQEATRMVDDAISNAENEKQARLDLQERFDMLKERNEKLEGDLANAGSIVQDNGETTVDLPTLATKICDDMSNAGINMAPIPGNEEFVLSGICQGCEASFDVKNRMFFVQKDIRKVKQAQAELEHLNNSDIRTCYSLTADKKLICKAFCCDTDECVKLLIEIASEISSFD